MKHFKAEHITMFLNIQETTNKLGEGGQGGGGGIAFSLINNNSHLNGACW